MKHFLDLAHSLLIRRRDIITFSIWIVMIFSILAPYVVYGQGGVAPQNHYKTWLTQFTPYPAQVLVKDQFMEDVLMLQGIEFLSNPTLKVHGQEYPIINPDHHLTWYRAVGGRDTLIHLRYENQFESTKVNIGQPEYLLVPTQKEGHNPPVNLDHYKAYRIMEPEGFSMQVMLQDQIDLYGYGMPDMIDSLVATYFLTPAIKNNEMPLFDTVTHYVAYQIFPPRLAPPAPYNDWETVDQFGAHYLQIVNSTFLLVPTTKILLGSIEGYKFNDHNGDGIKDQGDEGLQGWTINLSGPVNLTTQTDINGYYYFNDLPPGSYTITEVLQVGWSQTYPPPPGSHNVIIINGESITGLDFGNYLETTTGVNHYKTWLTQPLPFQASVNVKDQFMEDILMLDGVEFLSNPTLKIHEGQPYEIVNPDNHLTWYHAMGRDTSIRLKYENQFETTKVVIGQVEYLLIPTKKGQHLWPVNLDHYKAYRIMDPTALITPGLLLQDQFNTGYEEIASLVPTYFMTPAIKNMENQIYDTVTHYVAYQIFPSQPYSGDVILTWDQFHPIEPNVLQIMNSIYLMVPTTKILLGSIEGYKFNDRNGNGIKEFGEEGLKDWYISLNGPVNQTTQTDVNGHYYFGNLPAGDYLITEDDQVGWAQTCPPSPGSYNVTLNAGDYITDRDFGNFQLAQISGMVFDDLNHNSAKDIGEPGHDGIEVKLNASGNPLNSKTTITAGGGLYTFEAFFDVYTEVATPSAGSYVSFPSAKQYTIDVNNSGMVFHDKDFGLGSSWDSVKFRSLVHQDILELTLKGKPVKAIKRKAYQVEQIINLTAPDGKTDLHVEFQGAVYQIVSIKKNGGPCAYTLTPAVDGKAKKFDIVFDPPPLAGGDIITIHAYVKGSKPLKFKYYWTPLLKGEQKYTVQPTDPPFELNMPRLYMPNYINLLEEVYANGGFGTTGMLVGIARTDSPKAYGWLEMAKAKDVYKTLWDKTGWHDAAPGFFDVFDNNGKPLVKKQKSLPPTKHDNTLMAEIIACKLAIAASELQQIPYGFGYLIYVGAPFDGMTVSEIAEAASAAMTTRTGDAQSFFDALYAINHAFAGPIDSVSFMAKTVLTGVKYMADVPFLRANDATPLPPLTMPIVKYAEVPDVFKLNQNYPNPFNPTTTISFVLPEDAVVALKVYNVLGQEVATLANQELFTEGDNDIELDASLLSSGVYFYRITADGVGENAAKFTQVKKMLLLK